MVKLDPWGSAQVQDYARLRDEFGIEAVEDSTWDGIPNPHHLFTRGVVFGSRGLRPVLDAVRGGDQVGLMTGLMPSGRMHLGHKIVLDQVVWWQNQGADVHIAIADFEAYATRGFTLKQARELAIEEYVLTYLALGLDPEKSEIYFQTRRSRVKDLAYALGLHANLSQLRAIYGFDDSVRLAHINAPLMQAGDILHVQEPELGGPRPTIVPVGVDQDPHLRFTRDLAAATRVLSVRQTDDGKFGVFVKPETPPKGVTELLDDVERILRSDLGFGDVKRNDKYRAIYVPGATRDDLARIDLRLGQYESTEFGSPGFFPPAATYHRFMTGLTGDKMSSSKPESAIFVTDDEREVEKKLKRAKTGGRENADEQRRLGADPTKCSVYEQYLYHVKDERVLGEVYEECTTGKRLCGECKLQAIGLMRDELAEIRKRREAARDIVDRIVRPD